MPLGEYSFVPLLGRTLEYDTKQIDEILAAAKTMHGGARNDFVKVTFYAIGLINKHGGSYSHSLKQFAEELLLNYSTVQKTYRYGNRIKIIQSCSNRELIFWRVINIFTHCIRIWNIFLDLPLRDSL